ncbi:transglycosylase SLT domain-containing protein [Candidatus Daviesbacteria bacterium]|nr:transglycosylase SLT domain-containing protein [Candidatus Daviesbacteria bacterium]
MDQKDQENLPSPPPLTRRELFANLAHFQRSFEISDQTQAQRQQSPPEPSPTQETLSRRSFLTGVASLLVVALAGFLGKKMGETNPSPSTSPTPAVIPPLPDKDTSSGKPLEDELTLKSEQPTPIAETPLSSWEKSLKNHPLFSKNTPQELKTAADLVSKFFQYYQSEPGVEKKINNTMAYRDKASGLANLLGFYPDSFARKIILPLIFAESSGKADEISPAGAVGLCQLMQDALDYVRKFAKASDIKKLGITSNTTLEALRGDLNKNIGTALLYLHLLNNIFEDPSLVVLAYNRGGGDLIKIIKQELLSDNWNKDQKAEVTGITPDHPGRLGYFIRLTGINATRLIQKHPRSFVPEARNYIFKIAAAEKILQTTA